MGLLDGIIGGVLGAGMTNIVNDLIEKHGGVSGIVSELQAKGLGGTVQSWVGTGANEPVSGDQLHQALGGPAVSQLAAKFGISPEDLMGKLAEVLPGAVDKLTPNGVLPPK